MAKADAKQEIVTLKHLAEAVAENNALSKKAANEILGDFVGQLTKNLKKGAKIRIPDFGILQVRKRPARMGRNPATGEAIKIPAKTVVKARITKQLKDAVLPR